MSVSLRSVREMIGARGDIRNARRVWRILRGDEDPESVPETAEWVRQCYHRPSEDELRLHAADVLLGTHGVEGFELPDGSFLSYCNTGDSYGFTIVHTDDTGFVASTWADELERIEAAAKEDEPEEDEPEG